MKRLLIGLILLVTTTAVSAEWTVFTATDNFIQYVDKATIRRNGDFVKMWDLREYIRQQRFAGTSYWSEKQQQEYDCKKESIRGLAYSGFDGKMGAGEIISSNLSPADIWFPIQPDSIGEELWKIACGKQ